MIIFHLLLLWWLMGAIPLSVFVIYTYGRLTVGDAREITVTGLLGPLVLLVMVYASFSAFLEKHEDKVIWRKK